ncbi:recombinase family protein [Vibrio parahaemolyticus]|uniref:recombinase family protein n=1 Tax=Vibrio parahaemolyticus TaxID=670 RepID=UPI00186A105C|nr:recombinase family protein [Vibrio parahaemolyticus]MBE3793481.1 recombinase family protein [Vibrio parahaemolyticus]MBE3866473.1 recombinase family protein [Vibrio parahaemolyticus]MCC3796855.1 recombinase family protein [Vibrio parahaemolyticus]MCC3811667.1 recombinase family protein [Vibrio parahaemolyticus]MCR9727938.1 recombinase family protein [Vibrio parahaemolyticus]
MYIFGYLRASTNDQNAKRAQNTLLQFVQQKGHRVAGWYIENESGASLQRPELLRLLDDAAIGDAILIEQIDRLSRLDESSWFTLKEMLLKKELKVISLDLPTSHLAFSSQITDEFTNSMMKAINGMMMDMLAAIARKDYQDRRRRQAEGIEKAKAEGKYKGRQPDLALHEKIYQLRVVNKLSISDTAKLANVSGRTVIRVAKQRQQEHKITLPPNEAMEK